MKDRKIKAVRNSAGCSNPKESVCTGRELAEALAGVELVEKEARLWRRDLRIARRKLASPGKWPERGLSVRAE
jgi:hypothetical protein